MATATLVKDGRGPTTSCSVYQWSGDDADVTIHPGFTPSKIEVVRGDPSSPMIVHWLRGAIEWVLVSSSGVLSITSPANIVVTEDASSGAVTVTMLASTLSVDKTNFYCVMYR